MPAPKGNRNASKANPKTGRFQWRLQADTRKKLMEISEKKKLNPSEVLEILVLNEYAKIIK